METVMIHNVPADGGKSVFLANATRVRVGDVVLEGAPSAVAAVKAKIEGFDVLNQRVETLSNKAESLKALVTAADSPQPVDGQGLSKPVVTYGKANGNVANADAPPSEGLSKPVVRYGKHRD